MSYSNAQVATPSVAWQWESAYPRISTMQDGIGQTQYAYVAAGQAGAGNLASVDGPFPSDTIAFTYDDLGRANSRSINGTANTMASTFDALGRLASMTTGLGQFTYSYDAAKGLLQTMNYPNGEVASYTYFGAAQDLRLNTLTRKLGTTELFFERYTYLDNGNLLTRPKRGSGVPAQTLTYSYDAADQLLSVTNPSDAANYPQNYVYDPAANMTSSGAPAGTRAFTYNNLNERITDAGVAQQFDLNGNLSAGMGFTLTWDAEDRVKSITYNGTQNRVEYDYDGQGRRARIRLMQSGVTTTQFLYVWDGLQISERRDSAVPAFPVAMYFPQGERKFLSGTYVNYFYLLDRLGSVRGATSQTGSIIQSSDYLPYGPSSPQQPATTDPDFGFTGHLKCPFTGLTLAPYRVLGYASWLSRDPLPNAELLQGPNLYRYAANNPANLVDPDGRCFTPETLWDLLNLLYDAATGRWDDFAFDLIAAATPFLPAGTSKIDDAAKAIESFLGGPGKVITNAQGDKILIGGDKKIRFDINNPQGDKPHFHVEQQAPSGKWEDAGPQHRNYFND